MISKPTPAVKIVLSTKQSPKHKSTKLSHVFMMNGVSLIPKHFFVPAHYIIDSKHRHIHRGKSNIHLIFLLLLILLI